MLFMCFFEAPSSNVPINRLVKWVVLTSPLEWNHEFCFFKISIFFLVIHTEIQIFISTLSFLTILLERGQGSRAFTCSVCRFLPSIFNTQFFHNKQLSNIHHLLWNGNTLPDNDTKMFGAYKAFFRTPKCLTLIIDLGKSFCFKSVHNMCKWWKLLNIQRVMI